MHKQRFTPGSLLVTQDCVMLCTSEVVTLRSYSDTLVRGLALSAEQSDQNQTSTSLVNHVHMRGKVVSAWK